MKVEFVKPRQELVDFIAQHMRQADIDEVWASNHHTPVEAVELGLELSDYSTIVTVNDEPCVMIGLVVRNLLAGTGVPWMLGTDMALRHKRNFITQVPRVINEMLNVCPKLHNHVHTKNVMSVNWLRRIGFTIDEPAPYGRDGELFHEFHLERLQ